MSEIPRDSPQPLPSNMDADDNLGEQRQQDEQDEDDSSSSSSSADSRNDNSDIFHDAIGYEAQQAFSQLEANVAKLHSHLEKQFNDSEDDDSSSEEHVFHAANRFEDVASSSSGEELSDHEGIHQVDEDETSDGAEQLDEIIHMLNRQEELEEDLRRSQPEGYRAYDDQSSASEEGGDDDEDDGQGQQFVGKIFNLIESLQGRAANPVADEWENDDDAGYITVTLTETEFFDYEDSNASKLIAQREAAKLQKLKDAELLQQQQEAAAAAVEVDNEQPAAESEAIPVVVDAPNEVAAMTEGSFGAVAQNADYVPKYNDPFQLHQSDIATAAAANRRQSVGERRRSEIIGQHKFHGADNMHCFFNLKVIFEPYRTGFEESKDLKHPKGTILAGRYEVYDVLGSAAFSTALQCIDLVAEEHESQWVCLKVIKNNKDFFDQSLDEIKLLQYINSRGDPDQHRVLRLIDFFYYKEHLFIVSELLKENLYEFGRYIRENMLEYYYTLPRLKRISKQILEALAFVHSLNLIHCDVKPENIVIKSFSKCEIKLIDFGSSCFTTDHLTTYIQSRSYRAPEVIIGHPYDARIDIWSVGAVIAELYTSYVLFQNDSVPTMLSRITGILGNFPDHVLQQGKDTGKYFTLNNIAYEKDEEGHFHLIFPKQTNLASRLHFGHHHYKHLHPNPADVQDEELFVDFVRQLLHLDPKKRPTAAEALQHPWLSDADTVYFKEYIIGQPAVPPQDVAPQYEGEEEEEGDVVEGEDEDGESYEDIADDDIDDEDMNAALHYAKFALDEEGDAADDSDDDEHLGVTFQKSRINLEDGEDEEDEDDDDDDQTEEDNMNEISLDDEIAEFEATEEGVAVPATTADVVVGEEDDV